MDSTKYPIGIQSFQEIIEGGYTYVDKTGYLFSLVTGGKYYFLSRPRRFGKSLLLSTFHSYFEGKRELFKGLAIDRCDVDWTPSPVLHFDFNSEDFSQEDGLYHLLDSYLRQYEEIYGSDPGDVTTAQRFSSLIRRASIQTGRKVVILVDEYDKPLLGIEDNRNLFEKNQSLLKGFFGNLKSMDSHIRFAFLTGVARFNKVSIFSDLNNLNDISLSDKYSDICGWTEKELRETFASGIRSLSEKRGEDTESTLSALRSYYDGYLFSPGGERLYNPFSVLLALYHQEIESYWFESGTPTFLAKRVRKSGIDLPDLNKEYRGRSELVSVGMDSEDPVPLMFQTGYLTIDSYDERRQRYRLRFPNREVETGFAKSLYPLYVPRIGKNRSAFSLFRFQDDLYDGHPGDFMQRLGTLLKEMAYDQHSENLYRSIVWLLCTLCGTGTETERHSYLGRSDLEVETPDYIYVFEFKYNGSVADAMAQLRSRDYAGRFALEDREVYLIGANFSDGTPERGLTGYEIEELK